MNCYYKRMWNTKSEQVKPDKVLVGKILLLSIILTLFTNIAAAYEEELFFFAEEEIVITAAKYEQKITETPATVSVITAEQIRNRGYRSIVDLLKDVIGVDIIDNVARVEIGMRGINNNSDYGKHILLLLDGHDMGWKQFSRTRIHQALVNIDDIKRVEIIRGPGSALWGDSATLGIINIITRSAEDIDGAEVAVGGGTYHTLFGGASIGKVLDNGTELYFSACKYRDDTSKARRLREYSDILGYSVYAENQEQDNYNIYGKIAYRDFRVTGYKSQFDVYWPMATWGLTGDDTRLVLDKWFVKVEHDHSFNDKIKTKFSAAYDNYKYGSGSQYENFPGYHGDPGAGWFIREMVAEDDFVETELQLDYRPLENIHFVSGIEYEHLDALRWHYPYKTDGTLDTYWVENPPEFTTHNWAGYFHVEHHPFKRFGLTAGFRYDDHSIYGEVITPRFGIVSNPTEKWTLKALYGEAYYGPSIHELYYVKLNSSYGNPDLEPETIKTYELATTYKPNQFFSIDINLFQNTLSNVIAYEMREPDQIVGDWGDHSPTEASNQYSNIGKARVRGVETQFKVTPRENIYFSFYLTYRDPKNVEDDTRLENTPRIASGGEINLFLFDRVNVNLNMRYLGDRIAIREQDRTNPPYPTLYTDLNRKTASYYLANLTLRTKDVLFKGLDISLSVNNLFDKEYYDPGRVENYPQLGRNFIGSTTYRF